jgi:hypothetical protein
MGEFIPQAKACGYRSLSKESLNLGIPKFPFQGEVRGYCE